MQLLKSIVRPIDLKGPKPLERQHCIIFFKLFIALDVHTRQIPNTVSVSAPNAYSI